MSASETKIQIIGRQRANRFLNAPAPPLTAVGSGDLRVDQPQAPVDADVIERAAAALRAGQTHYVNVPGIGELRQAAATYVSEAFEGSYPPAQIIITAGIQEARFLTIQRIGEQYGHIALPAVVHPGARRALGVRPLDMIDVPAEQDRGYLPSLDALRAALDEGARLLYLESPSRLTGRSYDRESVWQLGRLLDEYDAGVIWDQGLAPWVPESYASLAAVDGMSERAALIAEAWPGTGLDSWFVGFIATPAVWFETMRKQKQKISICTATATQYAALEAAEHFAARQRAQLKVLVSGREAAVEAARQRGYRPLSGDACSVLAVEVPAGAPPFDFDQEPRVQDGAAFGAPDVVRLAVRPEHTVAALCGTRAHEKVE